jgi:hypothetical protein
MTLEPALEAAFRYTVTEADTARRSAAGEVPVLATPWVLALAEQATRYWPSRPLRLTPPHGACPTDIPISPSAR